MGIPINKQAGGIVVEVWDESGPWRYFTYPDENPLRLPGALVLPKRVIEGEEYAVDGGKEPPLPAWKKVLIRLFVRCGWMVQPLPATRTFDRFFLEQKGTVRPVYLLRGSATWKQASQENCTDCYGDFHA